MAANDVLVLNALYEKLLNRPIDADGLNLYLPELAGGDSFETIALSIESTNEYAQDEVNEWYEAYLGRPADTTGLNNFSHQLETGTSSPTVQAEILGSAEFFSLAGGTDGGFVTLLFQDLLGRTPNPTELAGDVNELEEGETPQEFATVVLGSQEYAQDEVNQWYETYLGRPADTAGLNLYSNELLTGSSPQTVQAVILGSTEFVQKAASSGSYTLTSGSVSGIEVGAGFTLTVDAGATVTDTTVDGGTLDVDGNAIATTIDSGSSETVEDGGAGANTAVDSDGQISILSGGTAIDTNLFGGGETVSSGGLATNAAQDGVVLNAYYELLLNRPLDATGLNFFGEALAAGDSFETVALSINGSPEYLSDLVSSWYSQFLHQTASSSDITLFTGVIEASGEDAALSQIFGSPEFFTLAGDTNSGFVTQLFQDLLGRAPTTTELNGYVNDLVNGETPQGVASTVLGSTEYVNDQVSQWLQTYLTLPAEAGDLGFYSNLLLTGSSPQTVQSMILGSNEFVEDLLGINPGAPTMNSFTWTGNGSSSSASDPNNWVDQDGSPGVPGTGDSVDFPNQAAGVPPGGSIEPDNITGDLDVASVSVDGVVDYTSGFFDISGDLTVDTPDLIDIENDAVSLNLDGVSGTIGGDLDVAQPPTAPGTPQYTDAAVAITNSNITVDGNINIGVTQGGDLGELDLENSTVTVANGSSVDIGGGGHIDLAGPNADLVTNQPLNIGNGSFGVFSLELGASFTTVGSLVLGQGTGGAAIVEVNASTLNVSGDLILGLDGADGDLDLNQENDTGPSVTTVSGNIIAGDGQNSFDEINIGPDSTLKVVGGGSIDLGQSANTVALLQLAGPTSVLDASGAFTIGDAGEGVVEIDNGASLSIAGDPGLAVQSTATGSIDLEVGSNLSVDGVLDVGEGGSATISDNGGSTLKSGAADIGEYKGSNGQVTVDASTWTVAGDLVVGDGGTGRLAISDGGIVTSQDGVINTGNLALSEVSVDGLGSSWTMSGSLHIGVQGGPDFGSLTVSDQASVATSTNPTSYDELFSGSLTLETGGQLTENYLDMHDAVTLTVESGATLTEDGSTGAGAVRGTPGGLAGNGTITIDDATLASQNAYTLVGVATQTGGAGNGTLTASDGATITSLAVDLGEFAGDSGTLILTGPGTTWTDTASASVDSNVAGVNVGVNGTGTLMIEDGATLSNPLSYIKIGQNGGNVGAATAVGIATVTGTDPATGDQSTLSAGGLLRVGDSGNGTLTVEDGGLVKVGSVQVGDFYGSVGEIDIDAGGTLTTNSASMVDVGPQLGTTVEAGSFVIGVLGGSQGTVNVDDGTLTVEGALEVGDGGSGVLSVTDGGMVSSQTGAIGTGAGNDGAVTVDGLGSSWSMSRSLQGVSLQIGVQGGTGTASLTVSNQGSVSTTTNPDSYDELYSGSLTFETGGQLTENSLDMHDAATLTVESGATLTEDGDPDEFGPGSVTAGLGGNGTITIDDATLASANAYTFIGIQTQTGGAGNGTLTASAGATITSLALDLGENAGDSGTVILTGADTTWTNTAGTPVDANDAGVNVGVEGTGTLTIEDGAKLSNPLAYIKIGQFGGTIGTATVTGANSTLSAGGLLRVGDSGAGTLTVEAGGLAAAGTVQVGDFSGSTGEIDIDAGGTVTTNSASTVDVGAQSGATVQAGSFVIGVQGGSQGTVKVDDGTLTVEGDLEVGAGGSGTLAISAGGTVSSLNGSIATSATTDSAGAVTVDGPGSSWSTSDFLHIGHPGETGTASLTVSNQASVTTSTDPTSFDEVFSGSLTLETGGQLTETSLFTLNPTTLTVESGATLTENGTPNGFGSLSGLFGDGTITIDDATLASVNAYTFIGINLASNGAGKGTLTASDGATITSLATDLGEYAGDTGTLTLTGPGTTWTDTSSAPVDSNDGGLNVGFNGTGTLMIEDGAALSESAYVKIGVFGGSTGTATVTGANSTLSAAGLLRVGDSGNGTLTVEAGGLAAAGSVQVGDFNGSTGEIDIDAGGTLTTNSTSTVDVGPQTGTTVQAGSFVIGVQGGSQGTVKVAGGTLTVDGDLEVGDGGGGNLAISAGGAVTAQTVEIGAAGTSPDTVTLDAGGTLTAGSVDIGPNGVIAMAGGTLDPPGTVTIDGQLNGSGTVNGAVTIDPTGSVSVDSGTLDFASGSLVNNNQITVDGATLDVGVDLSGTGTVTVTNGSIELDGSVSSGQTFIIDPSTIDITDPGAFSGTLDLSSGDGIIVNGATGGSYDNGVFTLTDENGDVVGTIAAPGYASGDFAFTSSNGALDITDTQAPCYCRGTLILTDRGERPVEDLAIGDRIITVLGELKPIKWIGRRGYNGRFIRGQRSVLPVVISAGALAEGVPARDLWVSPEHALYIDRVLVPAKLLVNGMTIAQVDAVDRLEYFHIELDSHDVILAEGAPAESYVECDNRLMFHNAAEFTALYPAALPDTGRFYALRIGEGVAAETIRERLLGRAAALGHRVTGDPGLYLIADGVAVEPLAVEDGVYRFTLQHAASAVYLASRSAVPAETDAASRDRRRLGVCLRRITLRDADLTLDLVPEHPLLRDGFHEPEGEHRWTGGRARLPAGVFDLFAGPIDVEIAIWPTQLRYAERAA